MKRIILLLLLFIAQLEVVLTIRSDRAHFFRTLLLPGLLFPSRWTCPLVQSRKRFVYHWSPARRSYRMPPLSEVAICSSSDAPALILDTEHRISRISSVGNFVIEERCFRLALVLPSVCQSRLWYTGRQRYGGDICIVCCMRETDVNKRKQIETSFKTLNWATRKRFS